MGRFRFGVEPDPGLLGLRTPGLFLGNVPPDVDPANAPANHSPLFDMDKPNLEVGVRVFSNLVVDYLRDR